MLTVEALPSMVVEDVNECQSMQSTLTKISPCSRSFQWLRDEFGTHDIQTLSAPRSSILVVSNPSRDPFHNECIYVVECACAVDDSGRKRGPKIGLKPGE